MFVAWHFAAAATDAAVLLCISGNQAGLVSFLPSEHLEVQPWQPTSLTFV
jgi:hypothetical protein